MNVLQGKVLILPSGVLLLSLLMFLFDPLVLLMLVGNVLIHELGHMMVLRFFHVTIRQIRIGITGVCIVCNTWLLGRVELMLCALGGPTLGLGVSFLCSFVGNLMQWDRLLLFAGIGAVLSGVNILPAKPLDGWRVLSAAAPRFAQLASFFTGCGILLMGMVLMYFGYGTGLALMGIVLLLQDLNGSSRDFLVYG